MNTQEIVAKLWNLCNVLRDDGITYHQYVTELTYILFLKMAKETGVEANIPEAYRWDNLVNKSGIELKNFYKELLDKYAKDIKVTYSSLHGVGIKTAKELLDKYKFNYNIVKEQCIYDGNFTTAPEPNPEYEKNYELGIKYAKENDSDIIILTDPDADRLGIYAKDSKTGEYMTYTGNMSALLIAEYRISQMQEKGILPDNGMMITTVVSSNLTRAIAKNYGLECIEVLTGFKNIGAIMKKEEEKTNGKKYVFGFEESYGCLIGDYARDKDGIAAVMSLCEANAYYKAQGITLWDQMNNIYKKYGYYKEDQVSIVLEGAEGAQKIKDMMTAMRGKNVEQIGKYKVLCFKDVDRDYVKDMMTGEECKTGLPKSNVLYYQLENNSWCCVRPSGTEPKIKLYFGVKGSSEQEATEELEKLKDAMVKLVKNN